MFAEGDWVLVDGKNKGFVNHISFSQSNQRYEASVAIITEGKFLRNNQLALTRLKKLEEIETFTASEVIDLALDTRDHEWFLSLLKGMGK